MAYAGNTDDIHGFDLKLTQSMAKLNTVETSEHNKQLVMDFLKSYKRKGNRKSTLATNCAIFSQILSRYYKKDLDMMTEDDFDSILDSLEREKLTDYNYRKTIKKFFRWLTNDDVPKWVKDIRMPQTKTPVQPQDLLTKDEVDRLLNACDSPREKAMIAIALDSALRVGALGTLKIRSVVQNKSGAVLYISPTSRNIKSSQPKPIPITWSVGYLNKWLDVHPLKDNPDAPLWVNLHGKTRNQIMTYKIIRQSLLKVAKAAGLKRRVFYHLFKHQKVTDMMLNGFSDQEINYQAGWAKGSTRMLDVYGNFKDIDMVKSIFERQGLKPNDEESTQRVTLKKCPRCDAILVSNARSCHQCTLVLDASLNKERDAIEEDVAKKAILKMMENPEVRAMFKEMLNK
jgi:integrase/recombinase XerD